MTVLERPVRPAALIGALRVALQSRRRQYQLRDVLESQRSVGFELQRVRLKPKLLIERRIISWPPFLTSFVPAQRNFGLDLSHEEFAQR